LASLPRPLRALPSVTKRVHRLGQPAANDASFAQLERNLAAVADRLRRQAPGCRVILIDYLTILPPASHTIAPPPPPPPPTVAAWGRAIATRLSATTNAAAEAAGWEFVAASAASADHHAWSKSPWTQRFQLSLRNGAPYHPNAAGMAAVADLVMAQLA
jgi:lysophospholipase L1-like esterase